MQGETTFSFPVVSPGEAGLGLRAPGAGGGGAEIVALVDAQAEAQQGGEEHFEDFGLGHLVVFPLLVPDEEIEL